MPIIPYFQKTNQLPQLPDAVLNKNKLPTVDNSGVEQAVGQLANASKLPTIDGKAMAAPFAAIAGIGEAISRAGSAMGALAEKDREAEDRIKIARADAKQTNEAAGFGDFQRDNPDPLTWVDERKKRLTALHTELLSDDSLSPRARQEIEVRSISNEAHQMAGTVGQARSEKFKIVASTYNAQAGSYVKEQNKEKLVALGDEAEKGGYWYPDMTQHWLEEFDKEGNRQQKQLRSDEIKAAENGVVAIASTDGEAAAIAWIEAGKFGERTPVEKQELRNVAHQTHREWSGAEMDGLLEGIDIGAIKNDADVDAYSANKAHLTPHVLVTAKKYLSTRNLAAEDEDRIKNGPRNYVDMGIKADGYKRSEDPSGEKYYALRQEAFQRVPPGMRNSILDTLNARFSGKTLPLPQGTKGYVEQTLKTTFDPEQGVNAWKDKIAVPVLDKNNKPVIDKATQRPKVTYRDDLKAKQRAIDARATVEQQVTDFIRENPKATIPQINQRINELLPNGSRATAIDTMRQKAIRHGIQNANDMPEPGLIIPADDELFPQ